MTRRASLLVAVVPLLALAVLAAAQNRAADSRGGDAAGPNTRPAAGPSTGPAAPAAARPATEPAMTHGRVTAVTIYQNSALVTREVDVKGPAGLTEVVVTPLPPQTIDSSLYTEGTDGLRVLSTRYRTRAVKEDTREEVRALIEKMRQLQQAAREMQSQIEVMTQNQQMLSKLENFTSVTMQQMMEKGMFNADGTVKLSQFVMDQRAEKSKAVTDLQEKLQANAEAMKFAQRQMGELTAGASRTERDAVIVVDKGNAADGKVRLNYLVTAATWRPMYKMRAGKDKDPVTVEYLAEIVQQSGESWDDVAVTLSTAEPMLNAAPPELLALDVTVSGGRVAANNPSTQPTLGTDNYLYSQTLRRQAQTELNANRGAAGWQFNNDAAALEQTAELLQKDDERAAPVGPREGQSVTYHLKSRLTLPTRNDPQLIEVARTELQPDYFYKAVPVLSPHVYRLAVLTNKTDSVLLPGEATMYLGTDFVGRMNVPLVAVGEQFTVGFGVDPQIQVTRELLNKTKSFQGGNQVQTFDYRIRVSSFKADDVKIQVWDRLPKGDQETVGIALLKTTPELSTDPTYVRADKPKNLLRWDLAVKPGSSGEKAATVDYQFRMEYARDVSIGNFRATK